MKKVSSPERLVYGGAACVLVGCLGTIILSRPRLTEESRNLMFSALKKVDVAVPADPLFASKGMNQWELAGSGSHAIVTQGPLGSKVTFFSRDSEVDWRAQPDIDVLWSPPALSQKALAAKALEYAQTFSCYYPDLVEDTKHEASGGGGIRGKTQILSFYRNPFGYPARFIDGFMEVEMNQITGRLITFSCRYTGTFAKPKIQVSQSDAVRTAQRYMRDVAKVEIPQGIPAPTVSLQFWGFNLDVDVATRASNWCREHRVLPLCYVVDFHYGGVVVDTESGEVVDYGERMHAGGRPPRSMVVVPATKNR